MLGGKVGFRMLSWGRTKEPASWWRCYQAATVPTSCSPSPHTKWQLRAMSLVNVERFLLRFVGTTKKGVYEAANVFFYFIIFMKISFFPEISWTIRIIIIFNVFIRKPWIVWIDHSAVWIRSPACRRFVLFVGAFFSLWQMSRYGKGLGTCVKIHIENLTWLYSMK